MAKHASCRRLLLITCILLGLGGCRDDERIDLKATVHRLKEDLRVERNRVAALQADLAYERQAGSLEPIQEASESCMPAPEGETTSSAALTTVASAPPNRVPAQRGPVTGPRVVALIKPYRAPAPATNTAAPRTTVKGAALGFADSEPSLATQPARESKPALVPLPADALQALNAVNQ